MSPGDESKSKQTYTIHDPLQPVFSWDCLEKQEVRHSPFKNSKLLRDSPPSKTTKPHFSESWLSRPKNRERVRFSIPNELSWRKTGTPGRPGNPLLRRSAIRRAKELAPMSKDFLTRLLQQLFSRFGLLRRKRIPARSPATIRPRRADGPHRCPPSPRGPFFGHSGSGEDDPRV